VPRLTEPVHQRTFAYVTDHAVFTMSKPLVRAVADPNAPLPSEFLLFSKGVNESCNGSVLFDARSLEKVLAQAQRHGVDFIVDLEHFSLWPRGENDRDARGWFQVEERDGELWAVNVTWTDDGAERLRARRQRYTSPAFFCGEWDEELQLPHVTSLINVAICSMPATYGNAALVASAGPHLDSLRTSAYARETMSTSTEVKPADPPAPAAQAELPPAAEAPPAPAAASADAGLSAEERAELEAFRTARNAQETAERRSLVTELIALNAETPATAWANGAPVARLASEPIAELRSRVAAIRSVPRASAGHTPPPAGGAQSEEELTDFERKDAAKIKDPEARARFVASRLARKQKAQ
jgi:phage I-like protein